MLSVYHSTARLPVLTELSKFRKGSWVNVVAPSEDELSELAAQFSLDLDLLHDAMDLYEAPRIETDEGIIYVYTRYYHPDNGVINATEPLLVIYHPDCIITILRIDSGILQKFTNGTLPVVTTQKTKTLLQFLAAGNDSYQAYVNKTTRHILSVRSKLKRTDISGEVLLGLVDIEDDLNEFLSALQPEAALMRSLLSGRYIKLYEEDKDLIEDLSLSINELVELVKSRLKTIVNIRQAYDAIAASELNRTFRRLTSISIFFMIPTIISGIYGMNILLPFAGSKFSFFFVMSLIVFLFATAILVFKRKKWL